MSEMMAWKAEKNRIYLFWSRDEWWTVDSPRGGGSVRRPRWTGDELVVVKVQYLVLLNQERHNKLNSNKTPTGEWRHMPV